jgi:hypothetical protein
MLPLCVNHRGLRRRNYDLLSIAWTSSDEEVGTTCLALRFALRSTLKRRLTVWANWRWHAEA